MLNLNYNINNAVPLARPGYIAPYNVQYILVAGGGGSAGGDNGVKVGQAGSGGQLVSGAFCIDAFSNYTVNIGSGGAGGARTVTFPNYTGSNGNNSTFSSIVALGGAGGVIQSEPTASFYAGNGIVSASFGNGGNGGQWTINLPGETPNGYIGGTAGEYITTNYYGGGGAGFNVNTLNVEFIAVAGGGAGASTLVAPPERAAGGGGAGGIVTGSFAAQPVSQSYSIIVGNGGVKGTQPSENGASGSSSSVFGYSASGGKGGSTWPDTGGGNAGSGSNFPNQGGTGSQFSGGGGGTDTTGSNGGLIPGTPVQYYAGSGGNGTLWLDGIKYGAGGFGAYTPGGGAEYFGSYGSGSVYGRGGGAGLSAGVANNGDAGNSGSVIIRYPGSGSKATGGEIFYSGSYTYHQFTASATFTVLETPELLTGGTAGLGGAGLTGSNAVANTGGGAGGSYYTQSGSLGGSGLFAIRYEGQIVSASGGEIVNTQDYTYHIFTSSGNFYSGEGNSQNKNINPCP